MWFLCLAGGIAYCNAMSSARLAARYPADAAALSGWPWSAPVVRVGAAVAAIGSLLALILGISRTVLAMSRDGFLPHSLSAVHPAYRVPHHAEVAVGLVVGATVMLADLRQTIGFSSFCILVSYGIANLSAWTLGGRAARTTAVLGVLGCVVVAVMLPLSSVLTGLGVVAAGAVVWAVAGGGADHGQAAR